MKIPMTLCLAVTVLALPTQSNAWVAYRGGCCWHRGYSCGGVSTGTAVAAGFAGLAAGAAIGAAVARPTYVVAPTTVYAPTYYPPPPVVVPAVAAVGSIYYSLPPGVQSANINGTQYYVLGNTYYRPFFGSNGVYYEVVANPI